MQIIVVHYRGEGGQLTIMCVYKCFEVVINQYGGARIRAPVGIAFECSCGNLFLLSVPAGFYGLFCNIDIFLGNLRGFDSLWIMVLVRKQSCDSCLITFQHNLSRIYKRMIQFHIQLEHQDFIATVRADTSIVRGSHSYVQITETANSTQKLMHHRLMHAAQSSMHCSSIIYIQV